MFPEIVVSGMRPTGALHLGHYHGALRNWVRLQSEHPCYFFVADWHALTTHYDSPEVIGDNIWEMVIDWLAAEMLSTGDLTSAWPTVLQQHYGAGFSVARRLGILLTVPRFLPLTGPVALRSQFLMNIAVRAMGNLVTDEDTDWIARVWRRAGRGSRRLDQRKPFS